MTSYRAFYIIGTDRTTLFIREFIADDFLHAVEQADDARAEGEYLINVETLDVSVSR